MAHVITALCLRDGACVDVCPVECIPKDPAHEETREQLMQKYIHLTSTSRAA